LDALRRHAPLIVALAGLGAVAAALFGGLRAEGYKASTLILFSSSSAEVQILGEPSGPSSAASAERNVANSAALLQSARVARAAAGRLGRPDDADEIAEAVDARAREDADVVEVTAEADSPGGAVRLANSYARAFRTLQVNAQADAAGEAADVLEKRLSDLSAAAAAGIEGQSLGSRIAELRALEQVGTGSPRIIEAAERGEVSKQGGGSTTLILGGVVAGLALGLGVALVRQQADRRLRWSSDLEQAFGSPVLAEIPRSRALRRNVAFANLKAADSEAFRILAAKAGYADRGDGVHSLLVTAATDGVGTSTIAWYLACASAASGRRTILVEADLRRPELAQRFGLDDSQGLAQVMAGEVEPNDAVQRVLVETQGGQEQPRTVTVLPSGPGAENPATLALSERLTEVLKSLGDQYDAIIVDSPPITQVADAIPLAKEAEGVLIVARLTTTTGPDAEALSSQLSYLDVPVRGVVANGGRRRRSYGYGEVTAVRRSRG
jgi:Mrp family chromosome partitioning ATPase